MGALKGGSVTKIAALAFAGILSVSAFGADVPTTASAQESTVAESSGTVVREIARRRRHRRHKRVCYRRHRHFHRR